MIDAQASTSTRPYLIRALYEWCTDNGFTPYIAVQVNDAVQVPREYVKDGEIVLNISFDATSSLKLGNDFIEFNARFAGTAREIMVPIDRVIAIYARENGQGMAFPSTGASVAGTGLAKAGPAPASARGTDPDVKLVPLTSTSPLPDGEQPPDPPTPSPRTKPNLTRVK